MIEGGYIQGGTKCKNGSAVSLGNNTLILSYYDYGSHNLLSLPFVPVPELLHIPERRHCGQVVLLCCQTSQVIF